MINNYIYGFLCDRMNDKTIVSYLRHKGGYGQFYRLQVKFAQRGRRSSV
jgi:hypothetical protein